MQTFFTSSVSVIIVILIHLINDLLFFHITIDWSHILYNFVFDLHLLLLFIRHILVVAKMLGDVVPFYGAGLYNVYDAGSAKASLAIEVSVYSNIFRFEYPNSLSMNMTLSTPVAIVDVETHPNLSDKYAHLWLMYVDVNGHEPSKTYA